MNTKLYIGNLPWSVDSQALREFFEAVGEVADAVVLVDRETNRSRGFGFVTMASEEGAKEAIEKLNGAEMDGRKIMVNEARPQEDRGDRRSGGFGGDRRGGFGGDRRGGGYRDNNRRSDNY